MNLHRLAPPPYALNGRIYVTGGYPDGGLNWPWPTVNSYDPVANTGTQKRDMPTIDGGPAASTRRGEGRRVSDGKLCVVSGC